MGAYQVNHQNAELEELLNRAEAGEEIHLEKNGAVVAKIVPFRVSAQVVSTEATFTEEGPVRRRGGQNASGLAGTDLSWLDEPWPEDIQRAFGMID